MKPSNLERTRINNKMPFAREGLPFIFVFTGLALLFMHLEILLLTVSAGIASLFAMLFFRDPSRENHVPENAVLTPADGRILEVQHLRDDSNPLGEPAVKMSIFMSVFNVHVNRIPITGRILKVIYHPGKFFSANLDKASEQNENNRITLATGDGRKIIFVQIAGLIARRIVCWIKEGDQVIAGQRFGLIRFGSRLDIYVPYDTKIIVPPRQKVKAGKTILGYLS